MRDQSPIGVPLVSDGLTGSGVCGRAWFLSDLLGLFLCLQSLNLGCPQRLLLLRYLSVCFSRFCGLLVYRQGQLLGMQRADLNHSVWSCLTAAFTVPLDSAYYFTIICHF